MSDRNMRNLRPDAGAAESRPDPMNNNLPGGEPENLLHEAVPGGEPDALLQKSLSGVSFLTCWIAELPVYVTVDF